MKRMKFTLGLALSFLLMGAGVPVNATDFIIIGQDSTLGASGTQTVLKNNPADDIASGGHLTTLNLSSCSSLETLDCSGNKIKSLDLTGTKVYIENSTIDKFRQQSGYDIVIKSNPDNPEVDDVPADASKGGLKVLINKAHNFNIDWAIVSPNDCNTNDNETSFEGFDILSSKGNEKDGLSIEVQGDASGGSEITFNISSKYISNIDGNIKINNQSIYNKGEEVHFQATNSTGNNAEGKYKFTMPRGDVKITLEVGCNCFPVQEQNKAIEREIKVQSNGLKITPASPKGYYYVAGHKDLTFTVHSEKNITVTNSRGDKIGDGILLTKNEDGTWKVTVRKISSSMVINVSESTIESGETDNAAIAGDAVWASNGKIHVKPSAAGVIYIYNVTGQLCKHDYVTGDATFALPKGFYIVKLNGRTYKVKN